MACVPCFEWWHSVHHAENNDAASIGPLTASETSRLVGLCADQIKAAVDEAFHDIDALSHSFLDTARHASALLGTLSDQNPDVSPAEDSPEKWRCAPPAKHL